MKDEFSEVLLIMKEYQERKSYIENNLIANNVNAGMFNDVLYVLQIELEKEMERVGWTINEFTQVYTVLSEFDNNEHGKTLN